MLTINTDELRAYETFITSVCFIVVFHLIEEARLYFRQSGCSNYQVTTVSYVFYSYLVLHRLLNTYFFCRSIVLK